VIFQSTKLVAGTFLFAAQRLRKGQIAATPRASRAVEVFMNARPVQWRLVASLRGNVLCYASILEAQRRSMSSLAIDTAKARARALCPPPAH